METLEKYLDRDLQRTLLLQLRAPYPGVLRSAQLRPDADRPEMLRNAAYLTEHGLIASEITQYLDGTIRLQSAKLTAKGLDFLEQDGGLTAMLGVVTVRLDAETIKGLIADKIEASPLPAAEKSRLIAWLQQAGQEGLKEATKRLVVAALDHVPEALQLLQTLPG